MYNPNSRRCSLRLHKKLEIDDPDEILLKKGSEMISLCCHRNKYKLKTLAPKKKTVTLNNNGSSLLQVSTN